MSSPSKACSRGTSSISAHIQVNDHCKRKPYPSKTQHRSKAMAGHALVVASTALQSHCQWVSPYYTHEWFQTTTSRIATGFTRQIHKERAAPSSHSHSAPARTASDSDSEHPLKGLAMRDSSHSESA
ncbi:hypothetical protein LR48_Vigan846s000400 [Vigna angularis]|uniref:Uncharacterized protein n=1 Tax=Phaseolus angularis TaxID=3914 RepID=A0A0L9THL8_PHAAN|nr:hypothetical protein LR48_Vigan846s000400 [Vigna angularis]